MNDYVRINRAEYERLRQAAEDLYDLRAFDCAVASLDRSEEELVPSHLAKRLIGGESPLRVYREWRGYTQAALGERAGVNRVQIADIEAGRKTGSVATVVSLAAALGVRIDDLV